MAITVTGANPTVVTVVSNTVTTDTLFPANAPNDRSYELADSLIGIINPGVAVGGFGLALTALVAGGGVAFTNHGFVSVDELVPALFLIGNGGPVTYAGTGTLTNNDAERALRLISNGGSAEVTVGGNITSNSGTAVEVTAGAGVTFTQDAGTVVSTALVAGADAVQLGSAGGEIVATLDGTILGGEDAFEV